jgi:hypothetical protein
VGAGAAHGGRVLAGIPDATDAAAAAPPAVYSAVMAAVLRLSFALVSSWLACGFMFAAALLLLFVRDPALDADVAMVEAASASARRAQAADALGDRAKARRWVERGLRELGHVSPRSRWETAVALAWQTVRQLLHRLWIGRAIDAFFLARTPLAAQATALAARLYQHQHQLQLKGRDSAMEALLSGVFAVNLMEAAWRRCSRAFLQSISWKLPRRPLSVLPPPPPPSMRRWPSMPRRFCAGTSLFLRVFTGD